MKTAARVECAAVSGGGGCPGGVGPDQCARRPGRFPGVASGSRESQRVEVVGQDAPADPGLGAVLAAESAAAQAVAALEVTDATLAPDAVARQSPGGAPRRRLLAAGDEDRVGVRQRLVAGSGGEAAVERDLARRQREPL